MPVKVKSEEWVGMKEKVLSALSIFFDEYEHIIIPESKDNFELLVDECEVHPSLIKKGEYMKLEYDFTLCRINIRTLSIFLYPDVVRIDFSLKN